jgi:ABC-2 type transport system ATP-binding protein
VLLSSHILAEAEALCDRVSIISGGRRVQHGTLDELRGLTRTTVVARTREPPGRLDAMPGVSRVAAADGAVRFDVDTEHLDGVVRYLASLGVLSLVSHPPTLEELFLRAYGEPPAAAPTRPTGPP